MTGSLVHARKINLRKQVYSLLDSLSIKIDSAGMIPQLANKECWKLILTEAFKSLSPQILPPDGLKELEFQVEGGSWNYLLQRNNNFFGSHLLCATTQRWMTKNATTGKEAIICAADSTSAFQSRGA